MLTKNKNYLQYNVINNKMSENKENNEEEEEIKIKIMLLGQSQIGKTSFIQRYVKNNFNLSYITTVGIDFQLKQIKMNNKSIKLQIWDTAGQERFKNITKSYFHSSDGFIVGYDITSRLSFTNVSTWLKEINDNAPEEIQKILIGNKCDLNEREVTTEEGKKLAEENGMKFFETSAKNDINVKETFEAITKDILDAQYKEEGDVNRNSLVIDRKTEKKKDEEKEKKKGCC